MTNAEKEAREIVREIMEWTGAESFPAYRLSPWADRILRFAREYGPEIMHREGMHALDEALPGIFAPVEGTTHPGWRIEYIPVGTDPRSRGKPF